MDAKSGAFGAKKSFSRSLGGVGSLFVLLLLVDKNREVDERMEYFLGLDACDTNAVANKELLDDDGRKECVVVVVVVAAAAARTNWMRGIIIIVVAISIMLMRMLLLTSKDQPDE